MQMISAMSIKQVFLALFFLAGSAYCLQAQSVMAKWNFENDSLDTSGQGHHLMSYGTGPDVQFEAGGPIGDYAMYFNNGKGFQTIDSLDNTTWSSSAVAFWVKDSSNTNYWGTVLLGIGIAVYVEGSGKIHCAFDGSSVGSLRSNVSIRDGNWHHVVAQNDGDTTFLYIDGVLDTTMAEVPYTVNQPIWIGTHHDDFSTKKVKAVIDNLTVYEGALTQAEIDILYSAGTGATNVEGGLASESLSLFPNPATGVIHLKGISSEPSSISLLDLTGRQIRSFNPHSTQLDVSGIARGSYFLQIQSTGKAVTRKVILQ